MVAGAVFVPAMYFLGQDRKVCDERASANSTQMHTCMHTCVRTNTTSSSSPFLCYSLPWLGPATPSLTNKTHTQETHTRLEQGCMDACLSPSHCRAIQTTSSPNVELPPHAQAISLLFLSAFLNKNEIRCSRTSDQHTPWLSSLRLIWHRYTRLGMSAACQAP